MTDEVADNVVALAFGQGHTALGELAADAGPMRSNCSFPANPSLFGTVSIRRTEQQTRLIQLSATQDPVWA